MAMSGKVDYHIHYFVDGCASDEMTLANIAAEAVKIGLEEICILKHYSQQLPNKEAKWVFWKRIIPKQFVDFLTDIRSFHPPSGLHILAGVETELLNEQGKINIPQYDIDKLDAINLSVHWFPELGLLHVDQILWPGEVGKISSMAVANWRIQIKKIGTEAILRNFVLAYVEAIKKNPKVRSLAHMFDGLFPLRQYQVPVDDLGEKKILKLMEPLMQVCAEKHVLWELTPTPVKCEFILKRANEIGVHFSATVDAHSLQILRNHNEAEIYISSLGLTKGTIYI